MVEGGGFEPPKVEPADLQSDPFGRSGTPPSCNLLIIPFYVFAVKLNFKFSKILIFFAYNHESNSGISPETKRLIFSIT